MRTLSSILGLLAAVPLLVAVSQDVVAAATDNFDRTRLPIP